MSALVDKIYGNAMIELVIDYPTWSLLLSRIGVKFVDAPTNEHAAWTNGKAIYINTAAVEKFNADPIVTGDSGKKYNRNIGKKEMMFLLCHELMHLIGLTYDRGRHVGAYRGGMSEKDIAIWKLWNIATDYEINSLLHNNEQKVNGVVKHAPCGNMPDWVLYESKYKDMTAEDIFRELYKEYEKNPQQFTFDKGPNGTNVDGLDFGLDEHMPLIDDATRNELIDKMADVFGSTTNGTGSSAMDRFLENTFKPQPFNWKRALTKYIRGWMKDNYTWNKPSRAGLANGIILPSAGKTPKMHIAVSVDTSESIHNEELEAMMNHLFTILTQFKDFIVDVWCCGSVVYEETFRTYTARNKRELVNFEYKSDGGNDMRKNFEFLRKHYKAEKPDLFICMSDFYDPLDGDTETTSPCPCIWMVLDHDSFVPPSRIKAETYPFNVVDSKNG